MKWEIRRVYYYLVSLVTFIMLLIGAFAFIMVMLELIIPGPPPDPCLEALHMGVREAAAFTPERCQELQGIEWERRRVMQVRGLIANLLFLGLVGPAYFFHWRQARRSESAG